MKNSDDAQNTNLHWSQQKEQAVGYWQIKLLLILFRLFPIIILRILAFPVGFFYFLFSKKARTESKRFLKKAAPFVNDPVMAKKCRSPLGPLRHIISFSLTVVGKIESWGGKLQLNKFTYQDGDIFGLRGDLESGKGVFLITSHLGTVELLRGLASFNRISVSLKVPFTAVLDTNVTRNFTRMMRELNPDFVDIIGVNEIGPDTAILLEERLAAGGIVTIAADRTDANRAEKNLLIPFLGEEAPFSSGVFYMAALMKAPVYFMFAMRRGDLSIRPEYDVYVHKSTLPLECSRKERFQKSADLAAAFAALLESYCKERPFQWYNFYDFWSKEV